MRPLVGSHQRLGARSLGGGVGIPGEKARRGGGGAGGSAGGGLRLRGLEFDDKLQALDFVSNGWKI